MRWTSEPSMTTATATLFHVTPSGNLRTFFSSCQYTGVHISGKSGIIAVVVLGTLTGGVAQGCAFYLRFSCAKSVNSGTFVILQNKKIINVWEPRPRTAIIPRNLAVGDGSLSSPCATFTERGGFQNIFFVWRPFFYCEYFHVPKPSTAAFLFREPLVHMDCANRSPTETGETLMPVFFFSSPRQQQKQTIRALDAR